jgi:2-oxoisovalerate dehydrogenase E1 component beta subunit
MERDPRVFLLGEDIGVYGGAFKVTEGFIERFGPERVMDTPIAEETIVGMSVGAAMEGLRPVAEFQYADFMTSGFDSIVTAAARYHYRSGVPIPIVLRAPSGGGVRASSFHSENPEPWFSYSPGLKVICPAFPEDAKGLLKSAIRDDNPCVFLEHKWIYRRIREHVSEDPDFLVPIGQARVRRQGSDLSIVTYGMMVHLALEAVELLEAEGISAEVVDLRTIVPLDPVVGREDESRPGSLREPPVPRHRRRDRIGDRRGGLPAPRRAGHAARAAERSGAVLSYARGRVPPTGGGHRGGRAQADRLVTREGP